VLGSVTMLETSGVSDSRNSLQWLSDPIL